MFEKVLSDSYCDFMWEELDEPSILSELHVEESAQRDANSKLLYQVIFDCLSLYPGSCVLLTVAVILRCCALAVCLCAMCCCNAISCMLYTVYWNLFGNKFFANVWSRKTSQRHSIVT